LHAPQGSPRGGNRETVPVLDYDLRTGAFSRPSNREPQRSSLDWLPNSGECASEILFAGGL